MSNQLLFSVAGARGIVGKTIDADVVTRLTLAYCATLPKGPVVVGRDTRPSGDAFIRYLEILRNPGTTDATASVVLRTGLQNLSLVMSTSDGDRYATAADDWVVMDDSQETAVPPIAFVFSDSFM